MPQTVAACFCLLIASTLIHYKVLRQLNRRLQRLPFQTGSRSWW